MQPVRAALRYSYHRMNFYRSIILAFPANYNGNICDIRRGRSQKKRRGFVRFDEGGLYDERSAGGRRMRAAGPVILFSEYIFQRGSFILPSRSTFPHYYFRAEGAEVICAMFSPEREGASLAPSRFSAQRRLPGPGKQALMAAGPQPAVLQVHRLDLIRRHQIGPVRADKRIPQLNLQRIETA